jgi:hypothetical protein
MKLSAKKILVITPVNHINMVIQNLEKLGEITYLKDPSKAKVLKIIHSYDAIFTNPNKSKVFIDKSIMDKATKLKVICTASTGTNHIDKLYKGRIALLRNNRTPLVYNKDNYSISPLSELGDASIAETTHFLIDTSGNYPIFFFEYNYHGPRISDIEYYIRQITNKVLRSSTACKASIHMSITIKDVLDNISDVLNFRIKANHKKLAYLNKEIGECFRYELDLCVKFIFPNLLKKLLFFLNVIT